jgi:hypothetical protein
LAIDVWARVQKTDPILITIKEADNGELAGLGQVLLSALGITGVLLLGAVLLGVVMAGLMFWIRSRSA